MQKHQKVYVIMPDGTIKKGTFWGRRTMFSKVNRRVYVDVNYKREIFLEKDVFEGYAEAVKELKERQK